MRKLLVGAVLAVASAGSWAVPTVQGNLYSVTTDTQYPTYGYISRDAFFNYNSYADEYARGFAVFDLSDYTSTQSFLSFTIRYADVQDYVSGIGYIYRPSSSSAVFRAFSKSGPAAVTDLYYSPLIGNTTSFSFSPLRPGDRFSLDVSQVVNDARSGGFGSITFSLFESGYNGTGEKNENVALTNLTLSAALIPEPSSYVLLSIGLLAVGTFARRKSQRLASSG